LTHQVGYRTSPMERKQGAPGLIIYCSCAMWLAQEWVHSAHPCRADLYAQEDCG